MICLPDDPQYLNRTADTVQGHSPLTGAEFHTCMWVARPDLGLQNCSCALCYIPRTTSLMIPAKLSRPPSRTLQLEYVSYLMSCHVIFGSPRKLFGSPCRPGRIILLINHLHVPRIQPLTLSESLLQLITCMGSIILYFRKLIRVGGSKYSEMLL